MASITQRREVTDTKWDHEFHTLRRENLFQNPPTDKSAYPALRAAIAPHIDSFNALFCENGLISEGIADIGTKTMLDGDDNKGPAGKNSLNIRVKSVFVEKSMLPLSNKFSTRNREIMPAECRERHVTYRGKMGATFEYQVNDGDWKSMTRDLGQLPLMLLVGPADEGRLLAKLIITVESLPLGERFTCTARSQEGGGRRIGRLLRGQRYRKADPSASSESQEFPNGHRASIVRRKRSSILEIWYAHAFSTTRSDITNKCPTLPQRRKCHVPFLVAEE